MNSERRFRRGDFIATSLTSLLAVTVTTTRAGAAGTLTLSVPAASMADRTAAFKTMFLRDYFDPKTPFPVYHILYEAQLFPDTLTAERAIGSCGDIIFRGSQAFLQRPPNTPIVLPYHVAIAGQTVRNEVTIPANPIIDIARTQATLGFTFSPTIGIRQIDRLQINGIVLPIPVELRLSTIVISAAGLTYTLHGDNGLTYNIMLDFTKSSGEPTLGAQ